MAIIINSLNLCKMAFYKTIQKDVNNVRLALFMRERHRSIHTVRIMI